MIALVFLAVLLIGMIVPVLKMNNDPFFAFKYFDCIHQKYVYTIQLGRWNTHFLILLYKVLRFMSVA